jgi:hypothetical protein
LNKTPDPLEDSIAMQTPTQPFINLVRRNLALLNQFSPSPIFQYLASS